MKPDDTSPVNSNNDQSPVGNSPDNETKPKTDIDLDKSSGVTSTSKSSTSTSEVKKPTVDADDGLNAANNLGEEREPTSNPVVASSEIPPSEVEQTPTSPSIPPTSHDSSSFGDKPTAWQADETEPETPKDSMPIGGSPKKMNRAVIYGVLLLIVVAVAVAVMFLFRNVAQPTEKPNVKVGVLMAFTGGSSNMGYGTMKGIQLAKKQLGADNIELVKADSKCDAATAKDAIKTLIDQGVVAIIGDGCSSASVAALPAANNSKTVMISPSASSTALSIPNDYFFRVIPNDNYQAQFIAKAIVDRGLKSVAVIYTNEPYGSSMNKAFQEKYESLGGKVVATAYSEPDVIDLSEQISTLKAANPQAVFISPNSVVTATAVIKIARESGMNVPLFGADILYDDTVIKNAPRDSEGLTVSTFSTGTSVFKQMLRNEYQVVEQLYAAPQAYDAFESINRAVQQGATSGEAIKNLLPSIQFTGMSGDIQFDQNGEVPGKDYVYDQLEVKDDQFTLVEKK